MSNDTQHQPFEKQLPKKLVRLLRKTQAFILANPKRFDMEQWVIAKANVCETVGCICGHMAMLDLPRSAVKQAARKEYEALQRDWLAVDTPLFVMIDRWRVENIPEKCYGNFELLFYGYEWPKKFLTPAGNITPKRAAKRIDYFLQFGY